MKIMKASIDDLEEVKELYRKVIEDLYNVKHIDILWGEDYPISLIEDDIKKEILYVLKEENKIVAVCSIDDEDDSDYESVEWQLTNGKHTYIHRLAVLPEMQGKGCAQKMLEYVLQNAKQNGYNIMRLTVCTANPTAIKLYEKNNFIKVIKGSWSFEGKLFIGYERVL